MLTCLRHLLDREQLQIVFSSKCLIFLHACGTCFELQSYISTMDLILIKKEKGSSRLEFIVWVPMKVHPLLDEPLGLVRVRSVVVPVVHRYLKTKK